MREAAVGQGLLGILGGMGPLAGAAFAARLVALTPAGRDQDHVPALLCNDPRIPDRSSARLGQGEDPLQAMLAGLRLLERAGASLIAIPCNTAHLWYEQMARRTRVPLLHIVEAVCDDLERLGARDPIGLMGTPATLKLGLYQEPLRARGYEVIVPDELGLAQCVAAIAAVKANRPAEAFEPAAACIRALVARGARAVVLGCTELPLAVPHDRRDEFGAVLTDSIDALARAALARCGREAAVPATA
ncbi:aspartate/glutamate racemase family protein [Ramlibacter tataouinensis]|uniref:Aspartate racemase-like protein n=1 Tax=Ramlibacter tataouinensis (strain ATCC BAA-407 / DSM 14655 / LMG 21543 / TTB310) TaxID=365046 RepID=F5Y3L5_RAMTT|nr:amino acid racemase [Ramlibacter tataouinensis]AEG92489.1 aspartate racemase-like protein [Ramlibacter tataouinensis TTB310]